MAAHSSNTRRTGPPPFDDSKADAILRSSDGVEFRVFRATLSQASPFFAGMFGPPPTSPSLTSSSKNGGSTGGSVSIVTVAEDSATLNCLLRICYPSRQPPLDELFHVERVIEAARKYQMDWAVHSAEEALGRLAERDALGAYATACRYGLKEAAQVAARHSLRLSVSNVIETLMHRGIHGEHLRALLEYRQNCSNAALVPTHMWLWTSSSPAKFWTTHSCCTRTTVKDRVGSTYQVQPWWIRYMANVSKALRDTPWEGVVEAKHALALYMSDGRGTCVKCLAVAVTDISNFTSALSAQISAQLAKVQLMSIDTMSEDRLAKLDDRYCSPN